MNDLFSYSQLSLKGPEKAKNGDHIAVFNDHNCLIAIIADGMGSHSHDFEASKEACDLFMLRCQETLFQQQKIDLNLMVSFCQEIDNRLLSNRDGRQTTFTAFVWYFIQNEIEYIHVGDTRLYHYAQLGEGLRQITTDDRKDEVQKLFGKLITVSGSVVTRTGVTRELGDGLDTFHTDTIPFHPGEILIMASDGIYESAAFSKKIISVLKTADMSAKLPYTFLADNIHDDASIFILRRNDWKKELTDFSTFRNEILSVTPTIPTHILWRQLSQQIHSSIEHSTGIKELTELLSELIHNRNNLSKEDCKKLYQEARAQYDDGHHELEIVVVKLQQMMRNVTNY